MTRRPGSNTTPKIACTTTKKAAHSTRRRSSPTWRPLPKGYSGTIKADQPQSIIMEPCAILSYDTAEVETVWGQELHARYHAVDTWLYRSGQWQIAASQVMRYYKNPAAGQSDPANFAEYVGTYEVSPESEPKTLVTAHDGQLFL